MSYFQAAFQSVCKEAKKAQGAYVCLMVDVSYYGGPEEGGWWGHDVSLVEYQWFPTEEQAETAAQAVRKLAKELTDEARDSSNAHCLREMDWLDARGLDADFLPEPDGPESYSVVVCEELPEGSCGPRHYE